MTYEENFPKRRRILVNAWQCPDGTILESRSVHDCQIYGKWMIDGGREYFRTSGSGLTFVGCFEDDPIEDIREVFKWGTRGKDGNQPLTYVKLMDMTDDHIKAILDTQVQIRGTQVENAFKRELEYRKV